MRRQSMGKFAGARWYAGVTLVLLCAFGIANGQSWTPVNQAFPASGAGSAFLLTDGTVMVHEEQAQNDAWYKLTPDINGSYANGTWTQVAPIPFYSPLFFGSAVLPGGQLLIEGGEYNHLNAVWTNMGAIYYPKQNVWKQVNPPTGWNSIGDAQGVILNTGTYMQANCCTKQFAYFHPGTLSWTAFDTNGKFDVFDEEGFNLLPNGQVLTVDAYVFQYDPNGKNSELYNPATKTWSSAGSTVVQLWDSHCGVQNGASFEVGPAARWHRVRYRGQHLRRWSYRDLQHENKDVDGWSRFPQSDQRRGWPRGTRDQRKSTGDGQHQRKSARQLFRVGRNDPQRHGESTQCD